MFLSHAPFLKKHSKKISPCLFWILNLTNLLQRQTGHLPPGGAALLLKQVIDAAGPVLTDAGGTGIAAGDPVHQDSPQSS